jgi:hypothetical protein
MKPQLDDRFLTGVIAVYLIVLLGIIIGTYYGTRPPVGILAQYNTPTQAQ